MPSDLRAVLISSLSRTALGQWPMGPSPIGGEDPEKAKHTGEITNVRPFVRWLRDQYGDLASNFTMAAGLWSKALFLEMDLAGLGVLCWLKNNKPDLWITVALARIGNSTGEVPLIPALNAHGDRPRPHKDAPGDYRSRLV